MNKRSINILIVEDEEAIRSGLIDVFVFHGYDVDSAATGPGGLRKALTGKFDLILLDIMLPGMDGYEICNQIRARDRDQPIIMLTAKTSDEEIVQGLKLGADDYVTKPFNLEEIKEILIASCYKSPAYTYQNGWNEYVGYGFVNAKTAVELSLTPVASNIAGNITWNKNRNSGDIIINPQWLSRMILTTCNTYQQRLARRESPRRSI